jgi:hypothetical protein
VRERAPRLDVDDDVAGADVAADGDGLLGLGILRGSTVAGLEAEARTRAYDITTASMTSYTRSRWRARRARERARGFCAADDAADDPAVAVAAHSAAKGPDRGAHRQTLVYWLFHWGAGARARARARAKATDKERERGKVMNRNELFITQKEWFYLFGFNGLRPHNTVFHTNSQHTLLDRSCRRRRRYVPTTSSPRYDLYPETPGLNLERHTPERAGFFPSPRRVRHARPRRAESAGCPR